MLSTFDSSTFDSSTFDCSTFDSNTFDSSTFDSSTFDSNTFDCKSCRRKNLPLQAFKFKRSMRFAKTCLICINRKRKYYWINKAAKTLQKMN